VGDFVENDEIIAYVETDKITVDIRSPESGKLTQLFAKEGDNVEVGKPFFEIDTAATKDASAPKAAAPKQETSTKSVSEGAKTEAKTEAAKTETAKAPPATEKPKEVKPAESKPKPSISTGGAPSRNERKVFDSTLSLLGTHVENETANCDST
jgi:2-oxoglutarate dehydrogenase E2 component (dihydrolipoamide succinyltransferase)